MQGDALREFDLICAYKLATVSIQGGHLVTLMSLQDLWSKMNDLSYRLEPTRLKINPNKTVLKQFGRRTTDPAMLPDIFCDGKPLNRAEEVTYLRTLFDCNFPSNAAVNGWIRQPFIASKNVYRMRPIFQTLWKLNFIWFLFNSTLIHMVIQGISRLQAWETSFICRILKIQWQGHQMIGCYHDSIAPVRCVLTRYRLVWLVWMGEDKSPKRICLLDLEGGQEDQRWHGWIL